MNARRTRHTVRINVAARTAGAVLLLCALAACDPAEPDAGAATPAKARTAAATRPVPAPTPTATATSDGAAAEDTAGDAAAEAGLGTPMEERVATLGLVNKRNNKSQDIELRPGEERRVGDVLVRLSACEQTAPWELPQETGAFVQVLVRQRGSETQFARIFSGWLFKNSPSLNVVEHPIYDVWVKDCEMAFPGEE